jgi:hypothetical protein
MVRRKSLTAQGQETRAHILRTIRRGELQAIHISMFINIGDSKSTCYPPPYPVGVPCLETDVGHLAKLTVVALLEV